MFLTLSEAVTGNRLTVAGAFNKWMTPVGLILLLLTGVGPLLAWRRASFSNIGPQFVVPGVAGLAAGAGDRLPRFHPLSGLCFALCGFVVGTIGAGVLQGRGDPQPQHRHDLFRAVGLREEHAATAATSCTWHRAHLLRVRRQCASSTSR
jgi:cytochrome c-type biogenesis protein CcmF